MSGHWQLPKPSRRSLKVVYRNFLVWHKLAWTSLVTHVLEPAIALFGLGLGVGALVGKVDDVPYIAFVASGMAAYSAVNSASFEALYSAFTRMHVQRTWESIMCTPIQLDDIIIAEWLWAGFKALMSSTIVLLMVALFGFISPTGALLSLPIVLLTGLTMSSISLVVNAISRSYENFSYFFTLFVTPMIMLSGLFFPRNLMPEWLQLASSWLPMTHTVSLLHVATGLQTGFPWSSVGVLAVYTLGALWIAIVLTRRRLLK